MRTGVDAPARSARPTRRTRPYLALAAVAVAVVGVSGLVAACSGGSGDGGKSSSSSGPASTSAMQSSSPDPSEPSVSALAAPSDANQPTASQEAGDDTPVQPGEKRSTLTIPDRQYADLDTGTVTASSSADADVRADGGRLAPSPGVQLVIVSDSAATGAAGCTASDRVFRAPLRLAGLEDGESLCVKTSKGRWAVLKLADGADGVDGGSSSELVFAVRLFA